MLLGGVEAQDRDVKIKKSKELLASYNTQYNGQVVFKWLGCRNDIFLVAVNMLRILLKITTNLKYTSGN